MERAAEEQQDELVTVVIPARNEEKFIAECLVSVLSQDQPNLQVLVIDGASTDRTGEIVQEFQRRDPRVELLYNPDSVISKSLNEALRHARGTWLVRIDAHSTVPPTYISRILRHLRTGAWGGVGGRKDGVGITPAGLAIAAAMRSRFGVGGSTYHYGTALQAVDHIPFGAYPTELARELGGWDERLPVNQDFEFDYRVTRRGLKLLFDPDITIAWHCRQSVAELFAQYRRYGRDKPMCMLIQPRSLRLRHLGPPALVVSWVAALIIGVRRRSVPAMVFGSYLLALGVATALTARTLDDRSARLRVPAAFVAMHVGWGIGFWEGVRRRLMVAATARSSVVRR